jgi:hypothetical protein
MLRESCPFRSGRIAGDLAESDIDRPEVNRHGSRAGRNEPRRQHAGRPAEIVEYLGVACVGQALGETPSDSVSVSVTSGRTSARCGKDASWLVSCEGC